MEENIIDLSAHFQAEDLKMSALNEIANIGIGHAARALASVCGRDFKISIPQVHPIAFEKLHELYEPSPLPHSVVFMAVEGDFNGRMAFFLDWKSCQSLWKMLLGAAPESPDEITEMEWSSVVEIGNIINGSFLSAFTEFTGLFSNATPPMLAVEQFEAILGSIAAESMDDHYAVLIETKLWDSEESLQGSFILIPSFDSIQLLWEKLGLAEAA